MSLSRVRIASIALSCLAVLAGCGRGDPAPEAAVPDAAPPVDAATEVVDPMPAPDRPVDSELLPYADVREHLVYGYFAFPSDMVEPLPAVVLVHDWWGLNEVTRMAADRLAASGYMVLAIDMYAGETLDRADQARQRTISVLENPSDVEENVRQALEFVDIAGAPSVGIVGWGFGGGWALNAALAFPGQIDAVALYYGQVGADTSRFGNLSTPVLGLFAESDRAVPVATVEAFAEATNLAGNPAEIEIYPDARHGFADPARSAYDPRLAARAWQRMLDFLAQTLTTDTGT